MIYAIGGSLFAAGMWWLLQPKYNYFTPRGISGGTHVR